MVDHSAETPTTRHGLKTLEIVLLLSLALNIFILGGVGVTLLRGWEPHFGAQLNHERKFDRFFEAIGISNLNSFQPFQDMRRDMFQGAHKMRKENQDLFDGFWTELQKPQPDAARLKVLIDEIQTHRQSFQMTQSDVLVDFLAKLEPEQRAAFAHIVMDRANPVGQPMRGFIGY